MKSSVVKRSVVVHGHKTSVSLEDPFWQGLHDIAKSRRMTLSELIGSIDKSRDTSNLSSTIRLFVLDDARARLAARLAEMAPVAPLRRTGSDPR